MTRKKCFSYLFLTILLFSNIGWSINTYSCQGQLQKTLFTISGKHEKSSCTTQSKENDCCSDDDPSEITKEKSCCKTEITQSNLDISSFVKAQPLQLELLEPDTSWFYTVFTNSNIIESLPTIPAVYIDVHAPPLFKLYCKLQFYG